MGLSGSLFWKLMDRLARRSLIGSARSCQFATKICYSVCRPQLFGTTGICEKTLSTGHVTVRRLLNVPVVLSPLVSLYPRCWYIGKIKVFYPRQLQSDTTSARTLQLFYYPNCGQISFYVSVCAYDHEAHIWWDLSRPTNSVSDQSRLLYPTQFVMFDAVNWRSYKFVD